MSKCAEYLYLADQCQKMADRAKSHEVKERWLALVAKWLAFAEEVSSNGPATFDAIVQDPSGATH
jgi:hypothetical protein